MDVSLNASLILPSLLEQPLTFSWAKSSQLLLRNPIIPSARCKTQIKPSIRLANAVPIGVINQAWLGLLAFYQGEHCHFKVREHSVAHFRRCFPSLDRRVFKRTASLFCVMSDGKQNSLGRPKVTQPKWDSTDTHMATFHTVPVSARLALSAFHSVSTEH